MGGQLVLHGGAFLPVVAVGPLGKVGSESSWRRR